MNIQANVQSTRTSEFNPIAAARAILPTLKETSLASEEGRQVAAPAAAALAQSGLSRMLTPIAHGGFEVSPSEHIRSCRILAEACSATAWVHMVCGAHNFVLGRYPEECQQEVFDGNPDALIPGTLAPQGLARQVAGGWILNGRWQFASGVDHGDWLLIGAKAVAENGQDALPPVHVFMPKRVFAAAGAHAIYNDSSLQSVYRDINTASHHGIVDFDGIAETWGKIELGLTSGIIGV